MKKEILGGIIIGLIIVGGIVGVGYYKYSANQQAVNDYVKTLEGMTDEQRQALLNQQVEARKDNLKSVCNTIKSEKNNKKERYT